MLSEELILNASILIIDDNILNVQILKKILNEGGFYHVTMTTDATKALVLYEEIKPDLVLVDFKMPHFNGIQLIEQFHSVHKGDFVPVIMITAEQDEALRAKAFQAGVKDFLRKPYERMDVVLRSRNVIQMCKLYQNLQGQNKNLEDNIKDRTQDLYDTRRDVVWRLARVAEFRDQDTGLHLQRMSQYAFMIAKLLGLSQGQCDLILNTVVLHDIGKVAVPDAILLKPGKLEPHEFEIMKKHTTWGAEMLAGSNSAFLKMAETIALTHHEKYDGTGYPRALKGESIPLVGRIAAVADVFDALTSARPYKQAWAFDDAFSQLLRLSSTHFDPKLIQLISDSKKEFWTIYSSVQ